MLASERKRCENGTLIYQDHHQIKEFRFEHATVEETVLVVILVRLIDSS